jgi:ethanolaminephosphotransferase
MNKNGLKRTHLVLSEKELSNLHNGVYVYKCLNNSLLEPFLIPLWESLVKLTPWWIHPNILTLLGSLAIVPSFFFYSYYSWSMCEVVPWWVCIVAFLGIFIFQTFDNMDGRQARRLRLSSPIGDWFDHSLDILSLYLLLSQVSTSFFRGISNYPALNVFAQLAPAVLHYFVFWDRRWTKELFLGPFAMTEGQVVISSLLVLGQILGKETITQVVFGDVQVNDLFAIAAAGLFTVISPIGIIVRVFTHPNLAYKPSTIIANSLDIVIAYLGCFVWTMNSPLSATHCRLMMWAMGICVTNVTTSMLLSSLMHGPFRGLWFSFLPWFGALNTLLGYPFDDYYCLICPFGLGFMFQLYLLYGVLTDLRGHLQIQLFHVPKDRKE